MNFKFDGKKNNDTYAEIDLKVLKKNFELIKLYANRKSNSEEVVKVCSIVKANAYGHGMNEVGKALAEAGTDYLGTADYTESVILNDYIKKFSKKKVDVLCLGILTDEKFFDEIISRNIVVTIADVKIALLLNSFAKNKNKKINIHIQVDSGINRIGFLIKDAYEAVQKIRRMSNLNITGIYSHYATSEIPRNSYALKQLSDFKDIVKELEHNVMKFSLKHISNTGGILNYNDTFFNMVRPGISLYGYYPDRKKIVKDIGINPVMALKSKVSFIKQLDKKQSISYGRKYFTKSKTKIVSIPVGYGDGYSRLLTNKARVFIGGKLYRIRGTVCMDWVMSEVGMNSKIKVNDEVILFGKEYPADNLSEITGTIPYEITCNVSSRVKRIYTE
ncbi:MAG: alanine racemase [Bacteroidota bacterium]|nr:alanine racemase [Bacteroidota bacterium]